MNAVNIRGDFAEIGSNGQPDGWRLNTWEGYKPYAPFKVIDDNGSKALHIYNVTSKHGFGWTSGTNIKCKSGDTLLINATVKGTGTLSFQLQYYAADKKWTGCDVTTAMLPLSSEWSAGTVEIVVRDLDAGVTEAAFLTFSSHTGAEVYIKGVKVSHEEGEHIGHLAFPLMWTCFAPMNSRFEPSENELTTIPAALSGVTGRAAVLSNSQLNFRPFFSEQKKGNYGWAFAEFESPLQCEYTIGAGADWGMRYYLNGQVIIDTLKSGNSQTPPRISDHTKAVTVKKGKNVIAIKFLSGSNSSVLALGGANELRRLKTQLKVIKTFKSDNYNTSGTRAGNPKIIQGYPVPGLLKLTGQGVYTAAPEVAVTFPGETYWLPAQDTGSFFVTGIRLQSFGSAVRLDSTLTFEIGGACSIRLTQRKDSPSITIAAFSGTEEIKRTELAISALPADLKLAVNHHSFIFLMESLVDSNCRVLKGAAPALATLEAKTFATALVLCAEGGSAEVVVDNYFTGVAKQDTVSTQVPFKVDLHDTIDPVKAGWKLVFSDEFNGEEIDWENTWYQPSWDKNGRKDFATLKNGLLEIKCDWDEENKDQLRTIGLWSRETFLYGYFESRLKFTKEPGWWAAFWAIEEGRNPMTAGGFEIDIFEDYYTRKGGGTLDHNLHVSGGEGVKSWNYSTKLPGSIDDWYVIAAKWSPFEVSYYLNGKLMKSSARHSPYASVTFDAFNHAFCVAPVRIITSGQIMREGDRSKNFPETYYVDYVRVYQDPNVVVPEAVWSEKPPKNIVRRGEPLIMEARAKSKRKIKAAYLFDNGFLIDYKTNAPFRFEFAIDKQHYENTAWESGGRQGNKFVLDGYPHSFTIAVQDETGAVGYAPVNTIIATEKASVPYQGQAMEVPGKILPGHFDDGGVDVAYWRFTPSKRAQPPTFRPNERINAHSIYIRNGEWVNYTVNVKQPGSYTIAMEYLLGKAHDPVPQQMLLMIDGLQVANFSLIPKGAHNTKHKISVSGITLKPGQHTITILSLGIWTPAFLGLELSLEE